MISILTANFLVIFGVCFLLWLVSVKLADVSVIDAFWGFGFVVVVWGSVLVARNYDMRVAIMLLLVTTWGVRLSLHLLIRNWSHDEDRRYTAMRDKRGHKFWWSSLYIVFWLQAGLLWLISFPIQFTVWSATQTAPALWWLDYLGIALWLVGFFFESVGDYQLVRFLADSGNSGKVLDRGLWRWTRHPNYFGDFCVWWGYFLIAAAAGGWWTIIGPLIMSYFLLRISGVTMLERDIHERRPAYRDYIRRTNAFFPGPPRKIEIESNA